MITDSLHIAAFIILIVLAVANVFILFMVVQFSKRAKESEYYTDYTKGKLVMRVYKYEFEYQAVKDIPRDKLLDRGDLNAYYRWLLYER